MRNVVLIPFSSLVKINFHAHILLSHLPKHSGLLSNWFYRQKFPWMSIKNCGSRKPVFNQDYRIQTFLWSYPSASSCLLKKINFGLSGSAVPKHLFTILDLLKSYDSDDFEDKAWTIPEKSFPEWTGTSWLSSQTKWVNFLHVIWQMLSIRKFIFFFTEGCKLGMISSCWMLSIL